MSKQFLAVGDYLINPQLLTFAVLDRGPADLCLRLAFTTRENDPEHELRLTGDVAKEVLRWLRLNSVFLTAAGGFGSAGNPGQVSRDEEKRTNHRKEDETISERYGSLDIARADGHERFLSQAGSRS